MTVRRPRALAALPVPVVTALLLLLPAGPPAAAATPAAGAFLPRTATAAETAAALRARVTSALSGSTARYVGASVDVAGLGAVVRSGGTASLPPASTEKLFTAVTALQRLGADRRVSTQLRYTGRQVGTHLVGDLYLVGAGDPYFTSAALNSLAGQVAAKGIRSIDGHLVVDETRYDKVRSGPGWKSSWVPGESGPLSAVPLDGNTWRTDGSFLADPVTPVLAKLRAYLAGRGVSSSATLLHARVPSTATVVASHASAPLSETLRRLLKSSDNFAAELTLKEIGWALRGSGTTASGAAAVAAHLRGQGVAVGTVADGSGLSPYARQSSTGEVYLLRAAEASAAYAPLRAALPVACKDGTLVKRFCGTVAAGKVSAKTGTLTNARALTGWTTTADGRLVRFSFLLSGFSSGASARDAIDRAVVVLAGARVG